MKKLFWGILLSVLVTGVPVPAMAGVDVNVSVGLPAPVVFAAPPELVVLPGTYVYAVPDVDADIFFYNGWWWRPWEGSWYRSRNYNSGWTHYRRVPSFYREIPSNWRNDYRNHRWEGHQWNYQRIPHQQVQKNWKSWEKNRHWEKQQTWGVKDFKSRNHSQQPYREVQQQQSRPQSRDVRPQRTKHNRNAGPQYQKGQPQHSNPQKGKHKDGKGNKQDRQ